MAAIAKRSTARSMSLCVLLVTALCLLAVAEEAPTCRVELKPGESIQAAIDAAPDGALICLKEGRWDENIRIGKSITLRGSAEGDGSEIWGTEDANPVLWVSSAFESQTPSVTLENLVIGHAVGSCMDRDDGRPLCASGVLAEGSSIVSLTQCKIYENGDTAITARDTAAVSVYACTVTDNRFWYAIHLRESAFLLLFNSTVSDNLGGVWVADSSTAIISDSTIADNDSQGLWVSGVGVTATRIVVSGNGGDGIQVSGRASLSLVDSTVWGNSEYGIALHGSPCYEVDQPISSSIEGSGNTIPGSNPPNGKADVCPENLAFLETEEGGNYGGP